MRLNDENLDFNDGFNVNREDWLGSIRPVPVAPPIIGRPVLPERK